MRIERFGNGEPEVAVIGGIHGDEPCGVRAIEALLENPPSFIRPVALVIANERAIDRGVRFVDEDLNRAFPGDSTADTHEGRLASRIVDAIGDCLTLSLHSTQSYSRPFGIVDTVDDLARSITPRLSLDALVEAGEFDRGRIFEGVPDTIEVECGLQGSEQAAENAITVARSFLQVVEAIDPGSTPDTMADRRPLPVYRLLDKVAKEPADRYDVHVENFEEVAAGQVFASADGEPVKAAEDFYPVLLSANGYDGQFGYTAEYLETID
ncbi:MAG: succinylglutamate desuccinylase/aspartoacylase family protein [Salinirussus sp.]